MSKKILAIITARGGSKGIPKKNLKLLNGRPLIYYTVSEAMKSKYLDQIGVSSDSQEILDYCQSLGLKETYKRPESLSGDLIPSLPVIQDYVNWKMQHAEYIPDYILLLQPTSPLRTVSDIDGAIELMLSKKADSIVSVVEAPHQFIPESIMLMNGEFLKPFIVKDESNIRQQKPKYFGRNGAAIYLFTYECLMKKNSIYGEKIIPYVMPKENSIDIDDLFDFEVCEYLIQKREKK